MQCICLRRADVLEWGGTWGRDGGGRSGQGGGGSEGLLQGEDRGWDEREGKEGLERMRMRRGSSVCRLPCAACLICREYLVLDGVMVRCCSAGKAKIRLPQDRVCAREDGCACVIRCEAVGAALCSLKGSGCRSAQYSSSTVLHMSRPLSPLLHGLCPSSWSALFAPVPALT